MSVQELTADKLRKVCDPENLGMQTTEDVSVQAGIIGQQKALEALRVGVGVNDKHFHLFVAGSPDTGKTHLLKMFLKKNAPAKKLYDWFYACNFDKSDQPMAVSVPAGKGREFQEDLADLIALLRREIPVFFTAQAWKEKLDEAVKIFEALKDAAKAELLEKVRSHGCHLVETDDGQHIIAVNDIETNGPLMPERFRELPPELQKVIQRQLRAALEALGPDVERYNEEGKKFEKEIQKAVKKLRDQELGNLLPSLARDIREKYHDSESILSYLDSLGKDVIQNVEKFQEMNGNGNGGPMMMMLGGRPPDPEEFFTRYQLNFFVDNSGANGTPVVVETDPTYTNIFGGIEAEMRMGMLTTNIFNIKAGALHRANGGYLIIPALNLFKQMPFCWEALKRTIKDQQIKIDNPTASYFGTDLRTLRPQTIPFTGKIILVGEEWLYHALYEMDDQFRNIFKVKVELDEETKRTPKMTTGYIGALAAFCKRNNLRPLDKTAVARVLDYLSEIAEDQQKFSLRLGEVENILKEADFWAGESKKRVITGRDIEKTLRKIDQRSSQMESRMLEFLKDEIIKIDVDGSEIGQINGLTVYKFSDQYFGLPARITAQVGLGTDGIINIERESKLSGNILTKSVYVIAGYLRGRYAQKQPLSLSASICFEQCYSGVDGDSASAAELFVLLSALAGVPIGQNFAITGSMNQKGKIQAIGGVNRKIRGFFRVCRDRGLTGKQGVIIPKDNLKELMLPIEIVEAVKRGRFHIWAIEKAEEGIELLTGLAMAEIDAKIEERLKEMNAILKGSKKENE